MINKILLVNSAHHAADGSLVHARRLIDKLTTANVAELALPLLAASTPSHIKVNHVDDYMQAIPWDSDADVIAISAYVMQLSRATEIADRFRKLGKIVVMGGFLPSMHPELVQDHVDSLCIGEGDIVWPQMLRDIEKGELKPCYKGAVLKQLDQLPLPRYDLIKKGRFISYPVQATRGCPYRCEYCSIIQLYPTYRMRPVEHIVRDITAIPGKYIHFTDDNLMENRKFCRQLFEAMKKLKVIWGAQVTVNVARDPKMLHQAWLAGCRMLAIGMESINQKSLEQLDKSFNRVDQFDHSIKTVQDSGIAVHALIVFGLPDDKADIFDKTVQYLNQQAVAIAEFFIYTPYPATPEGKRILAQGKIIDYDLNHYRESFVVFEHPHLSHDEIIEGYWRALRQFYSLRNIISRIWRGSFKNKWLHLFNNLNYWIKIKRGIVPVYFGRG